MGRYVRRARLWSGLVLAAFVLTHFANHIVAIHSLGAAESVRAVFASLWHFVPLQFALYTAIAAHFLCALYSLYIRRTLRMPAWEAAQVALGLLVVPLIALHVVGTRGLSSEFGVSAHYARTAAAIWATDTGVVRQFLLVAVVWLHLCYGIHFWLRLKTWYGAWQAPLFALAIVYPTLTMVGFLRAGLELDSWKAADIEALFLKMEAPVDVVVAFAARGEIAVFTLFALSLALVGVARGLRAYGTRTNRSILLELADGRRVATAPGNTVLDSLRRAGIAHASVCGGRGRCTTCRIRVIRGGELLALPDSLEREALARIDAPPNVRLACQARPREPLAFASLLPANASVDVGRRPGGVSGQESTVTALFLDLRGSTKLGERKLPYDVLFILNQFFAEMSEALAETDGHYAQFAGDGLMALYGLGAEPAKGAKSALHGAVIMLERMDRLNERLGDELEEPLRIGVGIHSGEAIVGTMGPPSSPNQSAIGDNINIAARLEAQTKTLGRPVVVSMAALEMAGVVTGHLEHHRVAVRGRDEPLDVCTFDDAAALRTVVSQL